MQKHRQNLCTIYCTINRKWIATNSHLHLNEPSNYPGTLCTATMFDWCMVKKKKRSLWFYFFPLIFIWVFRKTFWIGQKINTQIKFNTHTQHYLKQLKLSESNHTLLNKPYRKHSIVLVVFLSLFYDFMFRWLFMLFLL